MKVLQFLTFLHKLNVYPARNEEKINLNSEVENFDRIVLLCRSLRTSKQRDFGGLEHADDQAALLNPGFKPLTQVVQDDSFREFEFRQYLFAYQSKERIYFSACRVILFFKDRPARCTIVISFLIQYI
ncbi:hypothetical protein MA16_Dca028099 [Dendrobium catenatum]|uniref:Uncharacterized protein n=1 Tax=Dendrobium catenatum TaxID=906689 RepID=A0A2I0VG62_9ASPA|nr:hypothetical protein MA16_Dca028099 [Dendrobium catenatum]